MSIGGYKIRNQEEVHFITFAVVGWVDVFSRIMYKEILVDSLRFCQQKKGLKLHAWCIMTNHVHLLASATEANLSDILRDFKKYTAVQILRAIESNPRESRKDWMLPVFKTAGTGNARNSHYQFWRQDNQPKECFGTAFTMQKLNYIHQNPVTKALSIRPKNGCSAVHVIISLIAIAVCWRFRLFEERRLFQSRTVDWKSTASYRRVFGCLERLLFEGLKTTDSFGASEMA